jgi:hypothetical protein
MQFLLAASVQNFLETLKRKTFVNTFGVPAKFENATVNKYMS